MNTLLLALLATCPPGGDPVLPQAPAPGLAYPDAGPAPGCSSHQSHTRLFGWLRGHPRHGKCPCAGNGRAAADPAPVAAIPGAAEATATVVESAPPQPAPRLAPVPGAPPLAPADGAPGPSSQGEPVTTGAAPPRLVPVPTPPAAADDAPRRMPRGN